tara:strand:+ start:42 stop:650 length:609 start_codon:yes stop_codon:yes gene_type:complete
MCNEKCKKCCKNIPLKRYFLPLMSILALTPIEEVRTLVYLPMVIFLASVILFWNFTWIVYYTASKPLYYNDLFIDIKKLPNYEVDCRIKKRFKLILEIVLIITNSILMAILSDVWILRTNKDKDILSILGTTGGIIKIFQIINNTISRIMLKILRKCILKESAKIREKKREQIMELIQLKETKISVEMKNILTTDDTKVEVS